MWNFGNLDNVNEMYSLPYKLSLSKAGLSCLPAAISLQSEYTSDSFLTKSSSFPAGVFSTIGFSAS